jgi:N-succinyldiaminopimelate aminotransferase
VLLVPGDDAGMSSVLRASLRQFGTSVFSTITELAVREKAINLAQGFPDFEPPQPLLAAAQEALRTGHSQYAPSIGYPALRAAVAAHQAEHYGRQWDPDTEVTVTAGATEAIWSTVQALLEPGDEVVLVEPYYDMYPPAVVAAGGVPRVVGTTGFPDFRVDLDQLAAAFGPRTRLAIVNTPMNPAGRLLEADALRLLGELCQRYGAYVVADETYEHVVFDGLAHRPVAAEPALADRTVTVSSVSKTFSATGWRVGWATAPAELSDALRRVHQFVTFTAPAPLQHAVAGLLAAAGPDFYRQLTAEYTERRDTLLDYLGKTDLELARPQGAYFVMTRCAGDEVAYCRDLVSRAGVAAIPASAFYADPASGRGLVRFAFCKQLSTLHRAGERLAEVGGVGTG